MSSRVTPNTSPDAGVDVAGHADVDDEQRAPGRAPASPPRCRCARRAGPGAPVDASSTSHATSASGISSRGMARPPTRAASSSARAAVRLATTISRTPAPASASAMPSPMLAGAEHEDPAVVERTEPAGGERDRGRRHRHRVTADGGLGAGPLAHLDRVAERARQQRAGGRLALGRVPRLADLAEDLALADDHRVEAGRDPEEVRDRGVVVVRVEAGRRTRRGRRPTSRRGSRGRPASPGGTAWRGRRSRCGCTSRAARPRRGARRRASDWSALGSASGATAMRSRSRPAPCGG